MSIAELQVYSVEEADVTGGVCVVRCVGGVARAGQVYAVGELRLGLRRIERYGRPVGFFDAGHVAKVHLSGAMVALLSRGQVLTSVPPDAHSLGELEAWLATGPPLLDEPHPGPLRSLAVGRMQDGCLPDGVRLRWGRVALAAIDRAGRPEAECGVERAAVRGYLIEHFGPGGADSGPDAGPDRDPAALCRDVLAQIGISPEEALAQARTWRELPRPGILRLRRIKNLIPWMALARPHLPEADPLAQTVDAWSRVRPQLP